ncbi:RING/U-box [Glarea lozoyensis ATCC 20868]|uniref:RBR-type E3 ubiquitin transferase n=1 Tax=Glarea lozoyensis (strain ATCC 20868 / MF5171) TaxID=1116229 RepID=S3DD47_GLAL2|nr:RING/U-box [Glarea lozoyensis ATCC 20868]EPE24613.1 RING/U-box [Glarea lozoyensis ATCC 20868]
MDDATAATTFQLHLEEAMNHQDYGIAAVINRACEAHRGGRLNQTTRYEFPRDDQVPIEGLDFPSETASHTGQTTSRQLQEYNRGDDSVMASRWRPTEITSPGRTRLPFRTIPDYLRTPGPGTLETRLLPHVDRFPLLRGESSRAATRTLPFERLIGTPMDRPPLSPEPPEENPKCSSCFESYKIDDIAPSWTCEHGFCAECAIKVFTNSLSDTTRFPATCCGRELSLENFMFVLTPGLVKRYEEKKVETKAKGFCSNPRCSAPFKEEEVVGDIGTCSACQTITCISCKSAAHIGKDCSEITKDEDHQATIDLATVSGWRECFSCKAIVSRKSGCNHITCRCKAQWCYLCGSKWRPRTCSCPLFGFPGQGGEQDDMEFREGDEAIVMEDNPGDEAVFWEDRINQQYDTAGGRDRYYEQRLQSAQRRAAWHVAQQGDQLPNREVERIWLRTSANLNEARRQPNLARLKEERVRARADMLDWGRQRPLPRLTDRTERDRTPNGASQHRTRFTPESSRSQRERSADQLGNPTATDFFSFVPVDPSPLRLRQEQQPTSSFNTLGNALPPRRNAREAIPQQASRSLFTPSEVGRQPIRSEQDPIPRSTLADAIRDRNVRHRRAQLRYP